MYMRGLAYLKIDQVKARNYFKAGIASDAFFVKWRSIAGYFLTFFR